ncbi:MAG: alpha/beta fold hydrolase [Hydrogenophaga sp.]|jgi:dienelactone hydrolase|uniref:alpha/beta fold hydrolase n=1 Tax=Hydrogenophaga sp. TaxID=1904254 RepID=UPI001D7156A5|nr:alpha/beta fold hydrolase [Hydrogenophaga sp.]MBW0171304.1 alpha/beta hydrolase [Hydrogenophaga sp.]MBW0185992.1 alpha/beta hydrolase [Hydrogenophaga sp.]
MRWLLVAAIVAGLAGCATPSPQARRDSAMVWASAQGWRPLLLPGSAFDLQAFVPERLQRTERLTVYIEGDGLAWLDRHTPSFAPTPVDPLGLRLAVADAGAQAVYLARPCQYTQGASFKGCEVRYWGTHRFAPEVMGAMNDALGELKRRYGATDLVLVGYSGGGAVAALLAARRDDVAALVTVAGTLDTAHWTQVQRLSPLLGSLNPRDAAALLARVPQWHFVGLRDDVVPRSVLNHFLDRVSDSASPGARPPTVEAMPDFDHHCCWAAAWPQLSQRFAAPGSGR